MLYKIPPWQHQLEAIKRAGMLHNYAFLFEQGSGKTSTCINTLRHKFVEQGKVLRTIILCPPIVVNNWVKEWEMHSQLKPSEVVPLVGTGAKRFKDFQKFSVDGQGKVFVTNYESLLMENLFDLMEKWGPEAIVLDESHKCKSPSALRAKLAYRLANPYDQKAKVFKPKPHTYLLSGTPILNNPMDIFQQYKIMDGGATFGGNYFAFRARYFRDSNAGMPKGKYFPKWEVMTMAKDGFDALGEMNELIYSKAMRVEKKDCLDLPPEVSVTIKVGMSKEQERLYQEMKNDFVTFFNSQACTASLAITKALRLMQIASGFVSTENDETGESVLQALAKTPKTQALQELVEDITGAGGKVLVWAAFRHNYKIIAEVCKELKVDYVEVHGGIGETQKQANVLKFQTDPNCRVFIGHPGSGGIGINLTAAAYSIFYSRTFSLEHYLQARARNHRGGSKEAGHTSITHYDLICENTIDEIACTKLASKLDMSDKLLRDLVQEIQAQK